MIDVANRGRSSSSGIIVAVAAAVARARAIISMIIREKAEKRPSRSAAEHRSSRAPPPPPRAAPAPPVARRPSPRQAGCVFWLWVGGLVVSSSRCSFLGQNGSNAAVTIHTGHGTNGGGGATEQTNKKRACALSAGAVCSGMARPWRVARGTQATANCQTSKPAPQPGGCGGPHRTTCFRLSPRFCAK